MANEQQQKSDEEQYEIGFFAQKHGLPPEDACRSIDYAVSRAQADMAAERYRTMGS